MQFIGFVQNENGRVQEYLPPNEQMKNFDQRRVLFFNMYNFYVEKDLQIEKSLYLKHKNIKNVFIEEIETLLRKSHHDTRKKSFKVDIAATKIINGFINKTFVFTFQKPRLRVAKLINMIYKNGSFSLMMDLSDMFLNLVYERIKKVNRNARVVLGAEEIIIYHPNPEVSPTVVIPFYKNIKRQDIEKDLTVNQNINLAIKHLQGESIRQIFLVFPKSNSFSKHIEIKFDNNIKLQEDEYRVKMIPYSFSFCIKNQNKQRRIKTWQ